MARYRRISNKKVGEALEVTAVFEPKPRSGFRRAPPGSRLPRLLPKTHGSADPDDRASQTDVNVVVTDLARLWSADSVPRLRREARREDKLTPPEAYIVSLIGSAMPVQAIIDVSPMQEDRTLQFLAQLVTNGIVTFQ